MLGRYNVQTHEKDTGKQLGVSFLYTVECLPKELGALSTHTLGIEWKVGKLCWKFLWLRIVSLLHYQLPYFTCANTLFANTRLNHFVSP